jgi:hypothetical protein
MFIEKGFQVLPEKREVCTTMIENLHDLVIKGQGIEQVLQAEESMTT